MSKIFKISGCLCSFLNSVIIDPEPNFIGELVLNDDKLFYGYWDKYYERWGAPVVEKRFLSGAIAPNGTNYRKGIAFFELSNDAVITPIMYMLSDLEGLRCGEWAVPGMTGHFEYRGKAKISLEEQPYSKKSQERIQSNFEEVDIGIFHNAELLSQVQCCIDVLMDE